MKNGIKKFEGLAIQAGALIGCPSGWDFDKTVSKLSSFDVVGIEFNKKGDTVARMYWEDTIGQMGGCISIPSREMLAR